MTTGIDHDTLVLQTLQALLLEVDPGRGARRIALDHSLTRDLGAREPGARRAAAQAGAGLRHPPGGNRARRGGYGRQIVTALDAASATPRETKRGPARWLCTFLPPRRAARAPPLAPGPWWTRSGSQVEAGPDRVHLILRNDEGQEEPLTYGELYRGSLQCGRRTPPPRHRAGRAGRAAAANRAGVLPRLLRHAARGRRARPALSAASAPTRSRSTRGARRPSSATRRPASS